MFHRRRSVGNVCRKVTDAMATWTVPVIQRLDNFEPCQEA